MVSVSRKGLTRRISGTYALLLVGSIASAGQLHATPMLYGSSGDGSLFTINLVTGAGTFVGPLPVLPTEIEADNSTGRAYVQAIPNSLTISEFNINSGAAIGAPVSDFGSFTGLEFVGSTLYGTVITASQGPSTLRTLDPATGASVVIGFTGVGPISGLAYQEATGILYGIAGGPGPAAFYQIDLTTGVTTLIGMTGIQAGSLEFGPDGILYAGGTGLDAGNLYRISLATGAETLVGPTGFGPLTGLTLVSPVPEPQTTLALGLTLAALIGIRARHKRRRRI